MSGLERRIERLEAYRPAPVEPEPLTPVQIAAVRAAELAYVRAIEARDPDPLGVADRTYLEATRRDS